MRLKIAYELDETLIERSILEDVVEEQKASIIAELATKHLIGLVKTNKGEGYKKGKRMFHGDFFVLTLDQVERLLGFTVNHPGVMEIFKEEIPELKIPKK
jgi:hypothetical protein